MGKKNRWVKWVIFIVIIAVAIGFGRALIRKKIGQNDQPSFRDGTIEKGSIVATVSCTGKISSDSFNVGYENAVQVTKVYVKKYDKVVKGQKLFDVSDASIMQMLGGQPLTDQIRSQIEEKAKSPADGIVSAVNVKEGQISSPLQPAITVIETSDLKVGANISEMNVSQVKEGQKVIISGDSLGKAIFLKGSVKSVSPFAETVRTLNGEETVIEVVISIDDIHQGMTLRPGSNVSCDITTNEKSDIIVGKYEMLQYDRNGNKYIYVLDSKNKVTKKKVEIGIVSDMNVEITKGADVGDRVVLDPRANITDGMTVNIK